MLKNLIALIATFLMLGCASTPDNTAKLNTAITNYKNVNAQHKAMAIGYAPNGHWVAGWIYNQTDIATASEKAIAACKEQSLKMGNVHSCRIAYLNNEFQTQSVPTSSTPRQPPSQTAAPKTEEKNTTTGSGIFIDGKGLILTAEHVISDATQIEVITRDGERRIAKVESVSKSIDIAVLRVNYESKVFVPLKNNEAKAGSRIFTVGFPVPGLLGQEPKVSEGIISSLSGIRDDASFMQISIPIQPGNSGGSVITEQGELVGVVSSTAAVSNFLRRTGTLPQNVNWAARASMVLPLIRTEQKQKVLLQRDEAIQQAIAASVMIVVTK